MNDDAFEAVLYKVEQFAKQPGRTVPSGFNLAFLEKQMGRKNIRRGPGQREISSKDFRLAEEVRYIQRRAAEHDARFVTIGPLALFSTETGDAWLLDPADHLAARVARDGDPEPVQFLESDTNFAITWKGDYYLDGELFVYTDWNSARVVSVSGYPTAHISALD